MAATRQNVKSMVKSRKLQARKKRAFGTTVKAFDGRHVVADAKRSPKKKNFALLRKLLDNFVLPE